MKDETVVDEIARVLFRAHDDVCLGREPSHDFEGWRAVARTAIDLGARPARADARARLVELLGADSTNFLDTGLSLREFLRLHDAEKLSQSWSLQPPEERKRRLKAVQRLSIELAAIREKTIFSTRLAEDAIADVIQGDWERVESWVKIFSFEDEEERTRAEYAPVYASFRELLIQVLRAGKGGSA